MTNFMQLADEAGIILPDGSPIPEGAPSLNDPGNEIYTTRIDSAGEYRDSVNWLYEALDKLISLVEDVARGIEKPIPDAYTLAISIRKYTRAVDRRSQYDLMCKRLQRAKIGQSTETRLVLESIIADIEKEFL